MNEERKIRPEARKAECQRFDREVLSHLGTSAGSWAKMHTQECSRCAGELAAVESLITLGKKLPEFEPHPRVWASLRAALDAEGLLRPNAALQADFAAIQSLAKDLPEFDPSPRVWANLRAALDTEGLLRRPRQALPRKPRRWGYWPRLVPIGALAGLAALLLSLAPSGLFRPPVAPNANSETALTATIPGMAEAVALSRTVVPMERAYEAERPSLDPGLQSAFDRSLRSVDEAIQESQQSVEDEPGNALARQYLMSAYQEKAQVLSSALEFNGR